MTLLHVEKSLYQDVLVFDSATYGNVPVLNGVIQCTERDEFSYQEMIAHLPLASHPNPKKVLVIGGGDGGVVREVLKHDTIEQVVLCDIDEAVIRVSKQFLPHMSSLLNDPRVTVYVGDGFKFLADNTSTYDVIITDSSDPVGPAASLFQKPYFELLRDALTPGGHISTQGECLWIHPDLMQDLLCSYAQALAGDLRNTVAVSLDAGSEDPEKQAALEKAIAEHDLVISLVPYIHHANVIKAAIKGKTNVVTTSYISPANRELEEDIKKAGIVVMNEIGLDPGVDHLYAIKTIDEVHAKGGKIKEFHSFCGSLPAPECSDNPLGYKFSWSPRGGLLALLNDASYLANGQQVNVSGKDLMSTAKPYYITPAFAFVAYPNRNSVPFREFYNVPEAETVIRGTLRYQGFPEFVKALPREEVETLCARLETLMKYEEGERDLVMLQHKFIVEWADGSESTITSTLEAYGEPQGHSAMALYVGVPCGIAVQLILNGVFKTPGVIAPYSKEICDPIREILEAQAMGLVEKGL
ncbi:hypothetical protein OH77DRAFT_1439643 [Trametes cingulata]|nr:hypothetical protein OH77DRAFT_1439643 [Trametes cingulata]